MTGSEWALIIVTVVNMLGSVAITALRYYYRAHYKISDDIERNGHNGHT